MSQIERRNIMEQSIINLYGRLAPSRILRYFIENSFFKIEHEKHPYTFIVLGRGGPTGKTWLCTGLKEHGFTAFELTESIMTLVEYGDNKNHVIKNDVNKTITIVLNESFKVG
jgi:hypothetical protein